MSRSPKMEIRWKSHEQSEESWRRTIWCTVPFIYLAVSSLLVGLAYSNVVIIHPGSLIAFFVISAIALIGFPFVAAWLQCCDPHIDSRCHCDCHFDCDCHCDCHFDCHFDCHCDCHFDCDCKEHQHHLFGRNGETDSDERHAHRSTTADPHQDGKPSLGVNWQKWIKQKWSNIKDWINDDDEDGRPWRLVEQRTFKAEADVKELMKGRKPKQTRVTRPVSPNHPLVPDQCCREIMITAVVCAVGTVAGKTCFST